MSFKLRNFTIKTNDKTLFKNLNIDLNKGDILVIQGESGCGKSTLLKCIAGFINIDNPNIKVKNNNRKWFQEEGDIFCNGEIILDGENISNKDPRDRELGYLIQNSKIYPHLKSPKAVLEFLYEINKNIKNKYSRKEFSEKAKKIYDSLHFHIKYEDNISNLSGGEEQRLLLAKYLLLEPKLLLLDEPFSNLDYMQRENIREIIKQRIKDKTNNIEYVIMVSHDVNDGKLADKILYFEKAKSPKNKSFDFHIIKENTFESAFDVFSRLYGNWLDHNDKKIKENLITDIISNASNKHLYTTLFNNFLDTFKVSKEKKKGVFDNLLKKRYKSDIELEKNIKEIIYPLNQNLYNNSLIDRAQIIFNEIKEYLNSDEKILDVGCGDGRVANYIYHNISNNVTLTDIYKHPQLERYEMPFKIMNDDISLPFDDDEFDTSLLLTVLHHSNDPYKLLEEVKRVTKKRIIIIESILGIDKNNCGKFTLFKDKRMEYARLIDWLYNRIVYDTDVNVPYNFLCVQDWKKVFDEINLILKKEEDLGIDIKVVPEHHYLFVLEKE